jgi:PIN domain nuclease of toxin-antitoxin system
MTYLLDTGVWLRGVNQMETIPAEVLTLLQGREAAFGLSAISLWAVGKKVQIGNLKLPKDLAGWFADAGRSSLPVPGERGVRSVAPGG